MRKSPALPLLDTRDEPTGRRYEIKGPDRTVVDGTGYGKNIKPVPNSRAG